MTSPTPANDEFLLIGKIASAFGLRGQIKMVAITQQIEHLRRHIKVLYIGPKQRAYTLRGVAQHKPGVLVITLAEVATRDDAENLRGQEVSIRESDAAPLDEDEYFLHELYGMLVVTEGDEEIGRVREVLETGANEVLVVDRPGASEALIPMIHDVVQHLDIEGKRIVIRPLEGLL